MFAGAGYVPQRIRYRPGDIFVLVTDGVVELGEEPDAAFGLERLSQIIADLGELPLSEIVEAVNGEVKRHGTQQDDWTVLLIRAVAGNEATDSDVPPRGHLDDGNDAPEALEARWRKLLDELTTELAGDP